MKVADYIKAILKVIPHQPGVYQYYGSSGELLYVGKARDLHNRVNSYFNKQKYESGKTALLVRKITDIRYIVVESEMDALLLENSMIKEHQPRYNIVWKDDKSFPHIVIKKENFPRIFPTRQLIRDGSEYHGPFASVKNMHSVLDLARRLYPIRNCSLNLSQENIAAGKFKVCLEYHLGNCLGPCEGKQTQQEYDAGVEAIRRIIKGNYAQVLRELKQEMQLRVDQLKFEEAQKVKARIDLLENFQARSSVVSSVVTDVEVFTIVSDINSAFVNYMKVNDGAIVRGYTAELKRKMDESEKELLELAIVELRERFQSEAGEVCVPFEVSLEIPGVQFTVPQRGDRKKLITLSHQNAVRYMQDALKQQEIIDPERHQNRVMQKLMDDLRLAELPKHIECFDNSNFQGTNAVSACVVFRNAKPSKSEYRIFNVKTVDGPNDFDTMKEVVKRRYTRMLDEQQPLPQLVVIDGGKGQLAAALESLTEIGLAGSIAVIGIAKRLEEIYFPGDSLPLYIDKKSESLRLIQQLRDEAHRFGITKHRNKRSKELLRSELTEIPGIGLRTTQQLLFHFKSVNRVKEASVEELSEVVNRKAAQTIWHHFRPQENPSPKK